MKAELIDGFFYGLYMDPDILSSLDIYPTESRMACIQGYGIDVRGLVKAIPEKGKTVWGMVFKLSPENLHKMYSGEKTSAYRPEQMRAITIRGENIPVTCYNVPPDHSAGLNTDYLEKLILSAKKLGLPPNYIDELEQL